MRLAKNLNDPKVNLLCLSLTIFTVFILGCSSPKPQDTNGANFPTPFEPEAVVPFGELENTNGNTNGTTGNSRRDTLSTVIMYAVESRDKNNITGQSEFGCFRSNDVAIRYPSQTVGGRDLSEWDLVCKNENDLVGSAFNNCADLLLGGVEPEVGLNRENGSLTFIYKNLPNGFYEFTVDTRDPDGLNTMSGGTANRSFEVCE